MIILPAPNRPDLDCMAGALAYAALLNQQGKTAKVWLSGTPDPEAQFYLDMFPQTGLASDDEGAGAEAYVLVDFSEKFAMPDGFDALRVREIIDHRFPPDVHENFPNAKVQLEKVGAAATLVVERLKEANFAPNEELAIMLYGAIYSNTLCLKGSLATPRDHAMAAWLKSIVPSCDQYIAQQLVARSAEILQDPAAALMNEIKRGPSKFGEYSFSQFEISNGAPFWAENGERLMAQMDALGYPIVLNMIDLDGPSSIVYCSDKRFGDCLPDTMNFDGRAYRCTPALMRKEIAPYFR